MDYRKFVHHVLGVPAVVTAANRDRAAQWCLIRKAALWDDDRPDYNLVAPLERSAGKVIADVIRRLERGDFDVYFARIPDPRETADMIEATVHEAFEGSAGVGSEELGRMVRCIFDDMTAFVGDYPFDEFEADDTRTGPAGPRPVLQNREP